VSALAVPTGPSYVYRATCRRVIDGDTIVADVDLGFRITAALHVRIAGVNAPEVVKPWTSAHHDRAGYKAAAYLQRLLTFSEGQVAAAAEIPEVLRVPLLLASHRDERSFERWVADVWVAKPGGVPYSVAAAIIDAGHGKTWP
jgi:hypothetical protein